MQVEVLWNRPTEEKGTTATEVRHLIIDGKRWDHLVPKSVYRYITEHHLDERILQIAKEAGKTNEATVIRENKGGDSSPTSQTLETSGMLAGKSPSCHVSKQRYRSHGLADDGSGPAFQCVTKRLLAGNVSQAAFALFR